MSTTETPVLSDHVTAELVECVPEHTTKPVVIVAQPVEVTPVQDLCVAMLEATGAEPPPDDQS